MSQEIIQIKWRSMSLENSFPIRYPWLIEYWDFEKNTVNPYSIGPKSTYLAHWTCKKGHTKRQKVHHRSRIKGCPQCMKFTVPIEGSLAELHPNIAKDWDYEKNGEVKPNCIKPRHRHKRWWICPEKLHSYMSSPDNRVGNGSRCPYCYSSGKGIKRSRRINY